jgi:opacity protein-like surface antigen
MSQFKLITSLFVSATLLSTASFAQTIFKDEAMSVAVNAPHNWTGFYAGLNAGLVNHTMNITDNQATAFFATVQQVSNPKFEGGFQIGYRRQLDLNKVSGVFGVELNADFSNTTTFRKEYGSPFALYQLSSQNELNNLCLLQLIGGIAADKTLLFVAAGLSWTNITGNTTSLDGAPFLNAFNVNNKALGTALGGGIEYAFNEKFSARVKIDVITPNTYTTWNNTGNNYQIANSIVQGTFGVNYKFA